MNETKPESLACPSCGEVLKSSKTIGLPDSKTATCKQCTQPFSLGQARGAYAMTLMDFPSPPMPQVVATRNETQAVANVVIKNYQIYNAPDRAGGSSFGYSLLSLVFPGLGQLVAGRSVAGLAWFFVTLFAYAAHVGLGLLVHLLCIGDAAKQSD